MVDGFERKHLSSADLTREGVGDEDGVKVTTSVRKDGNTNGWCSISVQALPFAAMSENKEFTAELMDARDGEEITVTDYIGRKEITISKSIERECLIKLTARKGGYFEYIRIRLMA